MEEVINKKKKAEIVKLWFARIWKWFSFETKIFRMKNPIFLSKMSRIAIVLSSVCCQVLCIFGFCYIIGVVQFQNLKIIFEINPNIGSHFSVSDLVFTQTSMTLLVVSLVAIFPSIADKKLLGRNTLDVIFPLYSRFVLQGINILLFLLMFLNIGLALRNAPTGYIITCFLFSSLLLVNLVFGISSVFLHENRITKRLVIKCYKENIIYLKKTRPLKFCRNPELDMLSSTTIEYIKLNNLVYRRNIETIFEVSRIILFNHKESLQELYTEMFDYRDALSQLAIIAGELLEQGSYVEAIDLTNRLIRQLNYFEVVAVTNHIFNFLVPKFINKLRYISQPDLLSGLAGRVWDCILRLKWQVYLYTITDFSKCRLGKLDMIHYWASSTIPEDFYTSLFENKKITLSEKQQIFDSFSIFFSDYERDEKIPIMTNRDFLAHKEWSAISPVQIPHIIKAEPLALLYLKMIENEDSITPRLLNLSIFSAELQFYVTTLIELSVYCMLLRGNTRKFKSDLLVSEEKVLPMLDSIIEPLYKLVSDPINLLESTYSDIIKYYSICEADFCKGSIYGFHPKLRYEKKVVDSYFELTLKHMCKDHSHFIDKFGQDFEPDQVIIIKILEMRTRQKEA